MSKNFEAYLKKNKTAERRAQKHRELARFYNLNSLLGNDWAIFYALLGGRMTGKSYALTNFLLNQKKLLGDKCKCYWLRISETSTKALLLNKAEKLVDPDLRRKYHLELTVKGPNVYDHGKKLMEVLPLSGFAKDKGVARFDKDFDGWYNIVLDEFQTEEGEKRTSFDILYSFRVMMENIVRTRKTKVRIFLAGNTLEEASEILKAFNFLPQKFGRFYLRSKRCVIDNLEPTEEYLKDRYGSVADLLGGGQTSNYTNELTQDRKLLTSEKLRSPTALIMFGKDQEKKFILWDGHIIRRWRGESAPYKIAMKPYLDEAYNKEKALSVFQRYDAEAFLFSDLITQAYFSSELKLLKKAR